MPRPFPWLNRRSKGNYNRPTPPVSERSLQPKNDSVFDIDRSGESKPYRRSSKSSSIDSMQKGDLAALVQVSSVASSTASSVSQTPIERVWAEAKVVPLPPNDLGSGTRSYTHTRSIPVLDITWSEWTSKMPPQTYKVNKAGHQSVLCSLALNPVLRGQLLYPQCPDGRLGYKAVPLYLVENYPPGFGGGRKSDTAYISWMAYFDANYPGWDWTKPDWRGQEYICLQRKRLYSSLEIYDLRYAKWRTRISIYGYKLRTKQ